MECCINIKNNDTMVFLKMSQRLVEVIVKLILNKSRTPFTSAWLLRSWIVIQDCGVKKS